MIAIRIEINDDEVLDSLDKRDAHLAEISLAVYRLEQIKQRLLSLQFESEFEAESDYCDGDEE